MTLAVPKASIEAFLALARRREVEASVLGEFDSSGRMVVTYGEEVVCDLELAFLHDGLPRWGLTARWDPPARVLSGAQEVAAALAAITIPRLLARPNMRSNEAWARHYDHEVKGLSVIKPWVGVRQDVPSTATVMRARHLRPEGVVLGEGVHPYYSDLDTYAMAVACVDEAVRRCLCAGARIDRLSALDNFCWPDPVQGPNTPDGEHKLAQLVRCCEGLRAACEAFAVPLISGKDSMKNDAMLGGIKISIPPTLLVSAMGQIDDVRRALDLVPVAAGDLVFVLGETGRHLGGSEFERMAGVVCDGVPTAELEACARRYRAFAAARDAGLVRSAHVVSRGGLAVALAHLAIAGELGVGVDVGPVLQDMPEGTAAEALVSETIGRIVLTCAPDRAAALGHALAEHGLRRIGLIEHALAGEGWLQIRRDGQVLHEHTSSALRAAFQGGAQ